MSNANIPQIARSVGCRLGATIDLSIKKTVSCTQLPPNEMLPKDKIYAAKRLRPDTEALQNDSDSITMLACVRVREEEEPRN